MDTLFREKEPVVGMRVVHMDLKGVPPTPARMVESLRLLAACRCNAVLMEWEDSFPWRVDERFRSCTSYTPDDIRVFAETAAACGIEIIPLIQCLGHMETPLRVEGYEHLRLFPDDTYCLDPLADGARDLVQRMVDDVLLLLPNTKHLHLGGDEAFGLPFCERTKAYMEEHGKGALYMQHVGPILDNLGARGIRPILWHDMMIEWGDAALTDLAQRCDLMPWEYEGHPYDAKKGHCTERILERFAEHGITMWGGTAYKDDKHNSDRPNIAARIENATAWVEIAQRFKMKGVCATAWSRFRTDRVQCVPNDAALDALAAVCVVMHDGVLPEGGVEACVEALASVGEKERFLACSSCMERLTDVRNRGWNAVKTLAEQRALEQREPGRALSRIVRNNLGELQAIVDEADALARECRKVFAGLVEPYWLDEYLETRIAPLRTELTLKKEISP